MHIVSVKRSFRVSTQFQFTLWNVSEAKSGTHFVNQSPLETKQSDKILLFIAVNRLQTGLLRRFQVEKEAS